MPKGEKAKFLWQNPEYRKHMSDVHKGQIAWNKGKHPEYMQKENHPMWKGGLPKCIDCRKTLSYRRGRRCKKCDNKFRQGPTHSHWKGGRKIHRGYIYVHNPKHPLACDNYVLEHRLVMEKHLGRYLRPEEVVHHINGDTLDNRIENLQLFKNKSEHVIFHYKH